MLFILTGDCKEGKSRWLYNFNKFLLSKKLNTAGVLAPGIWINKNNISGKTEYKKIAINNILLPNNESVVIAYKKDYIDIQNKKNKCFSSVLSESQNFSSKKWIFDTSAINFVNTHFLKLQHRKIKSTILVDEIGPMELQFNEGFTSAVKLIKDLAISQKNDAIIIVRPSLVDIAKVEFSMWGKTKIIKPSIDFNLVYKDMSTSNFSLKGKFNKNI